MKLFALTVTAVTFLPFVVVAQTASSGTQDSCSPEGSTQFICTHSAPEDLALIPGTNWIVTSGLTDEGGIRLVNTLNKTVSMLFPAPNVKEAFDKVTYDDCPGPLDANDKAKYISQGNALKPGRNGHYTLYSVHRGDRESIEAFDIEPHGKSPPKIAWIGCVIAPNDWVRLNSVVGLPDGGLIATNLRAREGTPEFAESRKKLAAGEPNGFAWEWHTGTGWKQVPGTEGSGINGIEVSRDGKWLYLDAWGSGDFLRVSRGLGTPTRDEVHVGFKIDNVKWAPDGMLIATGQTEGGTRVLKIDPETLKTTILLDRQNTEGFGAASVAVPVGNTLWLGTFRGPDRIAIVPLQQ